MTRILKRTRKPCPQHPRFLQDVLTGLGSEPKRLSCEFFYDERGSRLFDKICELDDYYLTRTETEIMERFGGEMGQQLGPRTRLVEFGSGSSLKTRILLDQLPDPAAYVPVDISCEHLRRTCQALAREYPLLEILPVCGDFRETLVLPTARHRATHTAVYFPGSTIGNFPPRNAARLLKHIATLCGGGGGLLIGVDLKKETSVLERAYNDSQGVTAQFNLNLLRRMQRELDADLNVEGFEHYAFYSAEKGRVEIYIRSKQDQEIGVANKVFRLKQGELIHTEYSHKYTVAEFSGLAQEAGLELHKSWTDPKQYFAVMHFVVKD